MSLNPRFSILTRQDHDGSWHFHATDYVTGRSVKSLLFKTQRAAQAEAEQLVRHWEFGVLPTTNERGAA